MDKRVIEALEYILKMARDKNTNKSDLVTEVKWLLDQVKNM